MSRKRGAAGLLIAMLGLLVMLALPPSMRSWADTDAGLASGPAASAAHANAPNSAPEATSVLAAKPRHFHTVDEGAGASGWSSGSIAMALLALFAMLLVVAAFVLRAAQPAQGRR